MRAGFIRSINGKQHGKAIYRVEEISWREARIGFHRRGSSVGVFIFVAHVGNRIFDTVRCSEDLRSVGGKNQTFSERVLLDMNFTTKYLQIRFIYSLCVSDRTCGMDQMCSRTVHLVEEL